MSIFLSVFTMIINCFLEGMQRTVAFATAYGATGFVAVTLMSAGVTALPVAEPAMHYMEKLLLYNG